MSKLTDLLNVVVTTLQESPVCQNTRTLETQQFSEDQFSLKVRAEIIDKSDLQVRLYQNNEHTDYAYQWFRGEQHLARWDNKEHFPDLPTQPHHFHNADGKVESSQMNGTPSHDLPIVLDHITACVSPSSE